MKTTAPSRSTLRPITLAAGLACAALPAFAQQAQPQAEETTVITITAQRRLEELQKTPLAVTALSNRELEQKQIRRLDDLKVEVPNVVIEQNTGTSSAAKIFMRGVGTDESLFTADPSVAVYLDDTYIARQTGALFDMFDLQRVEVLRGPQGTLYGRNATGGAVRYITKVPTGEPRLEVDARAGNLGRLDATLSGGLKVADTVAMSWGLMTKHRDGYLKDITNNRKVNDEKINGGRVSLAFNVSGNTSARFTADYLQQRSGPTYASGVLDPARAAQFNRPVNNADGNLRTIETNLTNGTNDLNQGGGALSLATDMGAFEWRNIFSYRQMGNVLYIDLDGTAQTRFHLFQKQRQKQGSYESQFVSQGAGPFGWTGGLFVFKEKNTQPTRQDIFATGGITLIAQDTLATALYGQADYKFGGIWKATAGARYSRETKDFSLDAKTAAGAQSFVFADKKSWSRTDWRAGIDAQVTKDMLAYASLATGFKSGGFNGRAGSVAAAQITLKPETVTTYEIGWKSSFAGGKARFNATAFLNDYKDLQLTAFNSAGQSVLTNAASAKISGVEIDASAFVLPGWQLSANLGTLDAKYKDYSDNNAAVFSGKQLKQAPKLQYGVGSTWRTALAGGTAVATVQAKYTGSHYQNLANSEIIKTQAYTLVDARLGWEAPNNKWQVSLWGKNLTDKTYYTGGFDLSALGIADAYINPPRTYGVDLRYRFW